MTKPAHADERRAIWEPLNGEAGSFQRMNFFDFAGAVAPGGNHFHAKNSEVFLVVEGKILKIAIEEVRSKVRAVFESGESETTVSVSAPGEKLRVVTLPFALGPGTRIVMPTYHAHAIQFAPGSKMIAACSEPFDPADDDLNPYSLLDKTGNEIPRAEASAAAR